MRVLAIDIGSSAVKAGCWDGKRFRSRVRVDFASVFQGVRVEAPARRILRAVQRAGKEAMRGESRGVDVVSFCAFSSGLVITDDRGNVRLGAITHQDRRSVPEARELVQHLGEDWLLERTANLPYPGGIASSTLAWIKTHAPAALRGRCRVGQLSSLVAFMLTGEWTIDPSQAVFLGLWDIHERIWNKRLCAAVGVQAESLPRVRFADSIIGRTQRPISRAWSIAENTPVVGGFVDTSAAAIQTPMHPGQLVHNAGSTDVLALCLDSPRPVQGILARPVGVGNRFKERWLAVRTISAAGSALDWIRRTMFRELADPAWKRLQKKLASRRPDECLPTFVPNFSGVRAAISQDIGASFAGLTLATRREDLLAALIQGLVNESAHNYHLLARLHAPERTVYCMGGASFLADAMHAAWQKPHTFHPLPGDGLTGLVTLAQRSL